MNRLRARDPRPSQLAVLRAVEVRNDATADEVARALDRGAGPTHRSMIRLVELGYLDRQWERKPGSGREYSFYVVTYKGRAALREAEQAAKATKAPDLMAALQKSLRPVKEGGER